MADPKKNPLIVAFRAPVSSTSPPGEAPKEDVKDTQTSPNTVPGKPADEKRVPEGDKTALTGIAKPIDEKKVPEGNKAAAGIPCQAGKVLAL